MPSWPVLPDEVLAGVKLVFSDPLILGASFDDEEGAGGLLTSLFPDATGEQILDWRAALETWRIDSARVLKRARLGIVDAALCQPLAAPPSSVADSFVKITQTSSLCVLEFAAKKRMKAYRDEAPDARARRFEEERKKYSRLLAAVIQEARLPVARLVETLDDQASGWTHIFAARRANTLKNRYKAWKPFRDWLELHRGRVFPNSVKDTIDYVQHRVDDGCGRTVPESFHISLTLLEQVGKVPDCERISSDELWKSHVKSWTAELSEDAPPRKPAEMFTVAILVSLELVVVDQESALFDRALAWVALCMVWGSLRCDDVQAIIPHRSTLSNYGLRMVLGRSKTSGPDKRQKEVPVHILRLISLTGADWLMEGFEIWSEDPFNFRRDYLVMEPNRDFSGVRRKFVPPEGLSSLLLRLLGNLGTPRIVNSRWVLNKTSLLLPDGLETHFTGHSPRNFLTSVAATIGFSKDERAYLGRWAMGMAASEEYVRTSRQVVFKIQRQVNKVLLEGGDIPYMEDEAVERLCQSAEARSINVARIKRRHLIMILDGANHCLGGVFPLLRVHDDQWELVEGGDEELPDAQIAMHAKSDLNLSAPSSKFFITVSCRANFRRLHLVGCFVKPNKCCEVIFVDEVKSEDFDSICRTCKRKMLSEGGKEAQVDSSSTASSSSTEASGVE
ncbi:unnamed protein product [Durusdinium trenchii]|uniref:Uncharacterized protein n=1 Tax=Durusdinium trenchii TaxID=1381693 RepID=A0ABP0SP93_9DINO